VQSNSVIISWGKPQRMSLGYIIQYVLFTIFPGGIAPGYYAPMVDTRRYNKLLNDTLILFYLVNCDGITTVPERKSLIEKYLF
jgi:hypothetical protein